MEEEDKKNNTNEEITTRTPQHVFPTFLPTMAKRVLCKVANITNERTKKLSAGVALHNDMTSIAHTRLVNHHVFISLLRFFSVAFVKELCLRICTDAFSEGSKLSLFGSLLLSHSRCLFLSILYSVHSLSTSICFCFSFCVSVSVSFLLCISSFFKSPFLS